MMTNDAWDSRMIELPPGLYEDLKELAREHMKRQRSSHTLGTTGLVHEAYLKLVNQAPLKRASKPELLALAACAMRSVLVDYARRRRAEKRAAGGHRMSLNDAFDQHPERSIDLIALDDALNRLAAFDRRLARLVELRFFGGLSVAETADALDVSERTVQREWQLAKAWLRRAMGGGCADGG